MKILAVDQARNGGWAVYDYENKTLIDYGGFSVPSKFEYKVAIYKIKVFLKSIIDKYNISNVFLENIHYEKRAGLSVYEKLSMLKGALCVFCIENGYRHTEVQPRVWQGYLNIEKPNKKNGLTESIKEQSVAFVKDKFAIELTNNDIADAINIGWYVVNNIKIEKED